MEKKNTILLTVIAVATLLVAVVGATFAYFTATTTPSGAGEEAEVTTNTVGDVDLTMSATTTTNSLQYPGGFLVAGAKVTAKHDGSSPYNVTYTLNGSVDATNIAAATTLNWTLYEVTAPVSDPLGSSCQLQETKVGEETRYYYTGCTVSESLTGVSDANKIDEGTVVGGQTATIEKTGEKLQSAADPGTDTYYYLVVEYPNMEASQDADQGKTITATLSSIDDAQSAAVGG